MIIRLFITILGKSTYGFQPNQLNSLIYGNMRKKMFIPIIDPNAIRIYPINSPRHFLNAPNSSRGARPRTAGYIRKRAALWINLAIRPIIILVSNPNDTIIDANPTKKLKFHR